MADFAPVPPPGDLDQTTLSDFRLVQPSGELDETYASSFIHAHSPHYMKTWHYPQNRKYIAYRIAVIGDRDLYRKFGENWTCGFWDMLADRHTYRQTDRHADTLILRTPTDCEVIKTV